MATHPEPTTVPDPFTADPVVIRTGCNHNRFHRRRRWWLCNISRGAGRRFRSCTDGRRRVDHEIHNLVADAAIAQIYNVRRAQMKNGVGILYLADSHILANARFGQRLHIREAQRRTLVNPFKSLR